MGNMKEIGLLDCEDRPSVEENFKRVRGAILDSNGKLKSEVLPEGYPYEETVTNRTAIVKETVLTGGTNTGSLVKFNIPVSKMIETGKMYEVSIDGVTQVVECGKIYIPDMYVPDIKTDSFEITYYNTATVKIMIVTTDPALTSVSFSLYEVEEQTHRVPIANRFLPEGYPVDNSFYYDNSEYKDGDELIGGALFKVSDDTPSYEDLLGAKFITEDLSESEGELTSDNTQYVEGEFTFAQIGYNRIIIVTYKDNCDAFGDEIGTIPTKGVYMSVYAAITISKSMIETIDPKFLPTGAGIKTAIIKSSDYDNELAGIATASAQAITYECINMTFEEALQTMMAGEPLQIMAMIVINGFITNTLLSMVMISSLEGELTLGGACKPQDTASVAVTWNSSNIVVTASFG